MDNHLELLIDHSALSAKTTLLTAMLPVSDRNKKLVSKELLHHLSTDEADLLISMCATMDSHALRLTGLIYESGVQGKFLGGEWKREEFFYTAAVAPVINAFLTGTSSPYNDIRGVLDYMRTRAALTAPCDLESKISISRGACIRMQTSGLKPEPMSQGKMLWLGANYKQVMSIAATLRERKTCDLAVISSILEANALGEGLL